MTVFDDFVNENKGSYVFIPGYSTAECVALFWKWNTEHGNEQYSAPGAAQLWEQPAGIPYIWDNYDRVEGPYQNGDWCIWSGTTGAYPNGGEGHIAMRYNGQFFSQSPNVPTVMPLDENGIMGALRPKQSILPQPTPQEETVPQTLTETDIQAIATEVLNRPINRENSVLGGQTNLRAIIANFDALRESVINTIHAATGK